MELPVVNGRECVPVRLLPHLTRHQTLSPENAAQIFSWRHPFGAPRRWSRETYQLHADGTYSALQPRDWDCFVDKLAALQRDLQRGEAFEGEMALEWDRQSVEILPPGVFVWRDELELEYQRMFGGLPFFVGLLGAPNMPEAEYEATLDRLIAADDSELVQVTLDGLARASESALMTRPGDGELTFAPLLLEADRRLAFQGFEEHLQRAKPPASETKEEREGRRHDRLIEKGGACERVDGGWRIGGTPGALARLADEEAAAGRPYSDRRDVSRDVRAEAERRWSSRTLDIASGSPARLPHLRRNRPVSDSGTSSGT